MSQLKVQNTTAIEWEGELDDADLMAVTGGDLVGGLATGVANVNNGLGNVGTPTTGTVGVAANTVTGLGGDLSNINKGLEQGLQALNATVSGTAGQL